MYEYESDADREVAGLISACFALGRITSILDIISKILKRIGAPATTLKNATYKSVYALCEDIRYRFYSPQDIGSFLLAIGEVLRAHGSLQRAYLAGAGSDDKTCLPALGTFVDLLESNTDGLKIVSHPKLGSACKRLFLYLRWMCRNDQVDPGVWNDVSPSALIVPLDVHMHGVCNELGITQRKQANLRTALEVTDYFRRIRPDDPVRYDFCLTRMGIHPEIAKRRDELIRRIGKE